MMQRFSSIVLFLVYTFLFFSILLTAAIQTGNTDKNANLDLLRAEIDALKNMSMWISCNGVRRVEGVMAGLLPDLLNQQHDPITTSARAYADLLRQNVIKEHTDETILSLLRTFLGAQHQLNEAGYLTRTNNSLFRLYTALRGRTLPIDTSLITMQNIMINANVTTLKEPQSLFYDWKTITSDFMQGNVVNESAEFTELFALQRHCSVEEGTDMEQWRIVMVLIELPLRSGQWSAFFYVTFPLNDIDLNQCDDSAQDTLRSTHGCANSSTCIFIPGGGFELGHYECCCHRKNVSSSNSVWEGQRMSNSQHKRREYEQCVDGRVVEHERANGRTVPTRCLEYYQYNYTLRTFLFAVNILSIVAAFALIFVVITQRKVKDWGSRGWALMEFFLIGAILLYSIVILEYFQPVATNCTLIPWCRELGFALFYGAVVLKIHRNLFEHGVRKGNYVFIKEKDLLKYLLCIVAFTMVGLLSWTVTAMQPLNVSQSESHSIMNTGKAVTEIGRTKIGDIYTVCTFFHWNLIWHTLEFVFLSYGAYLSYNTRTTTWNERYQFTASVLLEMVVSLTIIIVKKHIWLTSDPDALLLVSFLHIHSTVTVAVVLIMATKLHYARLAPTARDHSTASSGAYRMHPSLAKLRDNLMNGTIDFAEMPITELNPEDIRAELKRVYTQLRMYKLTNLYMDNPHISKRKGGKKTSNRQNNRRFSIPTVPSKTSHKDMTRQTNVTEMDEHSSLTKAMAEDEAGSAGSVTDVTIHTSPHNVYFSKSINNRLDNRSRLDSDLSVCI